MASANSKFLIKGTQSPLIATFTDIENTAPESVLGAAVKSINKVPEKKINILFYLLIIDFFLYFALRLFRRGKDFAYAFSKGLNF